MLPTKSRGKYKPNFTPHVDCGDNVIIINADKCKMTGKKWTEHQYVRYTGYPGGQRFSTPAILQAKSEKKKDLRKGMHPLYMQVIKGMLPKNRLTPVGRLLPQPHPAIHR